MQVLKRLGDIIKRDPFRVRCLRALRALDLPQGYIGAGFVRNAIWDALHERATPTPLNDIDVIYFSGGINPPQSVVSADNALELAPQPQVYSPSLAATKSEVKAQEQAIERELARMVPQANWQVKNQARMHLVHVHAPYKNCHEAISYWIERETCVAVRLLANDDLDVLAPFGLETNFSGTISINPQYPRPDVFSKRLASKNWLDVWPLLKVQR
ncbi:nucleotidyltransferase family protein [Alteromonas sp. S015]|uniref:nucleotidyltransferase family protein n=1 Tax=Alteromonas sp. S015 TaxID=3117401 RepID=UPI002FE14948